MRQRTKLAKSVDPPAATASPNNTVAVDTGGSNATPQRAVGSARPIPAPRTPQASHGHPSPVTPGPVVSPPTQTVATGPSNTEVATGQD
ncbi:hypothetical protein C0J52_19979 [Blattella germanica]|nr:hypothetical protein C0J52_19979 [Blattella germanica]